MSKDKTYTLFWRTGDRQLVQGRNPAEAMTLAGYSPGALAALDFLSGGDCADYNWNPVTRTWDKKDDPQ